MTICGSSWCMTRLLTWRNPQGSEERWYGPLGGRDEQRIDSRVRFVGRVAVAEAGLAFLTVTATVETIAYAAFCLISRLFCPTSRLHAAGIRLLTSSFNTFFWSLADALIFNLFYVNLLTQEATTLRWPSYEDFPRRG